LASTSTEWISSPSAPFKWAWVGHHGSACGLGVPFHRPHTIMVGKRFLVRRDMTTTHCDRTGEFVHCFMRVTWAMRLLKWPRRLTSVRIEKV